MLQFTLLFFFISSVYLTELCFSDVTSRSTSFLNTLSPLLTMASIKCLSLNVNGLQAQPKRKAIFEYIRKGAYDVALLQETHCTQNMESIWQAEWGGKIIFSNGLSNSRGVAVLLRRGFDFSIECQQTDAQGRLIILQIKKDQTSYTVANIYAPTQSQLEAQLSFIDLLEEEICKFHPQNVILGGDFNLCSNPELDRNRTNPRAPQGECNRYTDRVVALCDSLMLFDVWRRLHPQMKRFSFRRGDYASRLDYWFASNHLLDVNTQSDIKPCPLSDHSSISLRVGTKHQSRGPGIWRHDNSLLQRPDYIDTIKKAILKFEEEPRLSNPNSDWEWLKFNVKTASIKFAKESKAKQVAHEKGLRARYEELTSADDENLLVDREELRSIERELKDIELHKANVAIERSRANWALYGEKPSKYYLNLQKIRSQNGAITQLIADDGQILSDHSEILAEERRYYQGLYSQPAPSTTPVTMEDLGLDVGQIPKITDLDREKLDGDYSLEELNKALKKLNRGRCPGSDGLTPEFYEVFWNQLAPHLCRSLRSC